MCTPSNGRWMTCRRSAGTSAARIPDGACGWVACVAACCSAVALAAGRSAPGRLRQSAGAVLLKVGDHTCGGLAAPGFLDEFRNALGGGDREPDTQPPDPLSPPEGLERRGI